MYRDRIVGFERIPQNKLVPHPKNWRTHPDNQTTALDALLAEVGIAGALVVRKISDDQYQIIDGHLRSTRGLAPWPCLVLDVDEDEAEKLLATYDPIGAMAESNREKLAALVEDIETEDFNFRTIVNDLSELGDQVKTNLQQLPTKPPPKMAWALIGIPLVKFDGIAEAIEDLGKIEGAIVETTVSDE